MHNPLRKPSRVLITFSAFAAVFATALPASAATSPAPVVPGPAPVAPTAATVSAVNSSMWQTDNYVWALGYAAVNGGRLFAGGSFTHLRAPGAAITDLSYPVGYVAAFNTADGTPDKTWKHKTDGKVQAIAVSPDGKTLYIGGLFNKVDAIAHTKVAAFDLTKPGYPLLPWNPGVTGGGVRALTVSADSSRVIVGGDFTTVAGVAQPRLAEVNASDGSRVTNWNPPVDGAVNALLITPDGNNVIVGGNFEYVNGLHHRALTSINVVPGPSGAANGPLDALIKTNNCGNSCGTRTDIKSLATDGTNVYVGAEGTGGGWFDGTLAFDPVSGHQVWYDNCLGATQAIAVIGGALYIGSHSHDCSAIGGFGQMSYLTGSTSGGFSGPGAWHHLIAEQTVDGKLLDWFPTTNAGPSNTVTASELGPRAMATDGTNLYVAGQFSQVNGTAQQGLTRFTAAPPRAKPVAVSSFAAQLRPNGGAVISWEGTSDPDSPTLTYKVYRDKDTTPFATVGPVWAHWYQPGFYTVRDSGLIAGTHSYRVEAVDESGNATSTAKFAASTVSNGYQASLLATNPALYWQLNEPSGSSTASDTSGHNYNGTYNGQVNFGVPGVFPGGSAITLGSNGQILPTAAAQAAPNTFAISFWFRTTTTRGGRIIGFGNKATSTSSSYDRMVYMTNSGQLIFGVYNNRYDYLWTPKNYNDGTWHYVVAEIDPTNGMRLYVDAVQIGFRTSVKTGQSYSGYWRVGADNLSSWPQRPSDAAINADLDEVSVHSAPLSQAVQRKLMSAE